MTSSARVARDHSLTNPPNRRLGDSIHRGGDRQQRQCLLPPATPYSRFDRINIIIAYMSIANIAHFSDLPRQAAPVPFLLCHTCDFQLPGNNKLCERCRVLHLRVVGKLMTQLGRLLSRQLRLKSSPAEYCYKYLSTIILELQVFNAERPHAAKLFGLSILQYVFNLYLYSITDILSCQVKHRLNHVLKSPKI